MDEGPGLRDDFMIGIKERMTHGKSSFGYCVLLYWYLLCGIAYSHLGVTILIFSCSVAISTYMYDLMYLVSAVG
jgi:hypothetical protein